MAVFSGPEIVNNGLVFYYDMSNTKKSWKGKPTTNLIDAFLGAVQMVSLAYVGLEDGWKKYSLNGTWTAGTYPYTIAINGPTFTGGVSYSSACYLKTNVMHKFNYFGTGMNYVNQPMNKVGTSFGVLQSDGSYYCGRSDFEYTSSTAQAGYILSNPIANVVFSSATDFVWLKDAQVEQGSFPTPFAGNAATRSNTQAILDLANNNTITTNSLTYASNNTFSFNGSSDYISLPDALGYTTAVTAFAWFKSNGSPTGGYHIIFGGQELEISIPTTGEIRTGVFTNSRYVSNHGSGLLDGNWHHVGFTFDGATKTSYIDGISVGGQAVLGTLTSSFSNRTMGKFGSSSGYYLNGSLGSVSIYNRALSAQEVRQNFEATRSRYGL